MLYKSAKEREELDRQATTTKALMHLHSMTIERDKEIRWMLAIGRRLHLALNTVGLATAILDRILRLVKVKDKYVHCMSVAAMSLAVKFHEEIDTDSEEFWNMSRLGGGNSALLSLAIPSSQEPPLSADDLAALIRESSSFTQQELNRMERTLLSRLGWDMLLPSFDRFLQAMLAVIGAPHLAASSVLRRNFEVVMSSCQLCWHHSPPVLALSLLSTMLQSTPLLRLEWPRVTESLRLIFQIDELDLEKCRWATAELLRQHWQNGKRQNSAADAFDSSPSPRPTPSPTHLALKKGRKRPKRKNRGEKAAELDDPGGGGGRPAKLQ